LIAKAERIQTVVSIISVQPDRFDPMSFSIDALVPDFTTSDRSIPTKFIKWSKEQGNAPAKGDEGLAVLEPTVVQKRHVDSGKYPSNAVTGDEMAYEVNWAMLSFSPVDNGDRNLDEEAMKPRSLMDNTNPVVNRLPSSPAPSVIDGTTRHKVDTMSINDRESIRMVITHGQSTAGGDVNIHPDMESVLEEAEAVADWLNNRFLMRLAGDSPMVQAAIESGARIVNVAEDNKPEIDRAEAESKPEESQQLSIDQAQGIDAVPKIKNEKELRDWINSKGYTKQDILKVLRTTGSYRVTDYLGKNGNTAYGLALELHQQLSTDVNNSW
jgi:hypothetical protein